MYVRYIKRGAQDQSIGAPFEVISNLGPAISLAGSKPRRKSDRAKFAGTRPRSPAPFQAQHQPQAPKSKHRRVMRLARYQFVWVQTDVPHDD